MGPAPAVAAVRLAVRRVLAQLAAGDTVLVACSGGADSLALLAGAVFETRRTSIRAIGVCVDHGLQDGSAEHTARVVEQMASLGADETASIRVQVEGDGLGPEAAAREARYAALGQLAEHFGADMVLLGHTLDDQAETVLLGLARGSGGRSIAGMRRAFEEFRRPLLDLTRADTVAACEAQDIEFWSDPHNDDPRFARSRVRTKVLPVLEDELGPGVAGALARTADQLREDQDYFDLQVHVAYDRARIDAGLDLGALDGSHPAITSRVVREACLDSGVIAAELTRGHVLAVLGLHGRTGKEIQLPGHVTAYVDGDLLRFRSTR